jgi:hypothetical protein
VHTGSTKPRASAPAMGDVFWLYLVDDGESEITSKVGQNEAGAREFSVLNWPTLC